RTLTSVSCTLSLHDALPISAGARPISTGVPARSARAKRRGPRDGVRGAIAEPSWRRTGCDAPLRSMTSPCPTMSKLAGDGPRAYRHCPSVGAYAFPPEGHSIALFMQRSIGLQERPLGL